MMRALLCSWSLSSIVLIMITCSAAEMLPAYASWPLSSFVHSPLSSSAFHSPNGLSNPPCLLTTNRGHRTPQEADEQAKEREQIRYSFLITIRDTVSSIIIRASPGPYYLGLYFSFQILLEKRRKVS